MGERARHSGDPHGRILQPPQVTFPSVEVVINKRSDADIELVFYNPLWVIICWLKVGCPRHLLHFFKRIGHTVEYSERDIFMFCQNALHRLTDHLKIFLMCPAADPPNSNPLAHWGSSFTPEGEIDNVLSHFNVVVKWRV